MWFNESFWESFCNLKSSDLVGQQCTKQCTSAGLSAELRQLQAVQRDGHPNPAASRPFSRAAPALRRGPTCCPSYLASSGSVNSRTGASAGGGALKRSSRSAAVSTATAISSAAPDGRPAAPPAMPPAPPPRASPREERGTASPLAANRSPAAGSAPRAALRLPAAPRRAVQAPARPGTGRAAGFGRAASRRCHAEAGAVCVLQGGTARGARRRGGLSLVERRSRLFGRGGSGGAIPSLLVPGVPVSPSAAELQKGAAFRILRGKAAQVRRCSCSGCVLRTPEAARGLLRRSCGCWPRGASPQGVVVQLGAARSVPAVSVHVGAEGVRRWWISCPAAGLQRQVLLLFMRVLSSRKASSRNYQDDVSIVKVGKDH